MKVLIAEHIEFQRDEDDNQSSYVFGEYRIIDMTESEFLKWSDDTGEDWISEEYEGKVYFYEEEYEGTVYFSSPMEVNEMFREAV